jgi:hypothetical protein
MRRNARNMSKPKERRLTGAEVEHQTDRKDVTELTYFARFDLDFSDVEF